jgi:predicted RNase H-like HicB family nuclease
MNPPSRSHRYIPDKCPGPAHNCPLPTLLHELHRRLYPGTHVPVISGRIIENIEILVIQLTNMQESKIFTAVLHKEEDMYVAECPEVGTFSQGKTIEEAVDNLKEATELYLEEFPVEKEFKTIFTTFEVASIAEASECIRERCCLNSVQ